MKIFRYNYIKYIALLVVVINLFLFYFLWWREKVKFFSDEQLKAEVSMMFRIYDGVKAVTEVNFLDELTWTNCMENSINNYLVYVYSYDECRKCILNDISMILGSDSILDSENFYVLPVVDKNRNSEIMIKTDLKGLNYRMVNSRIVHMPQIGGHDSRLFLIFNNGEFKLPFVPNENRPELTINYFQFVRDNYFMCNDDEMEH